jgi:hypothetical protein
MKQDRFLLGILIAIAALVIIALGMFFTRQDQQEYMEENTPEGVVHDYALAVIKGDYEKAYSYLAEAENKPSYQVFRQAFFSHYVDPSNAGLEIGEIEIVGDDANVTIYLLYKPTDPFSSSYRNSEVARLERQHGSWKLLQMPYNFWAYDWYQPTPKPIY